jgi:hypothetical protein
MSVVNIRTVVDLPAPFGPEEAEDLAALDLQVDATHRFDRTTAVAVVLDELLGFHRQGHEPETLSCGSDKNTCRKKHPERAAQLRVWLVDSVVRP